MEISTEIFDITQFVPITESDLKPGDVYLHREMQWFVSEVNGHAVYMPLNGGAPALHMAEFRGHARTVHRLARGLSFRLRPLSEIHAVAGRENMHGMGACFNGLKDDDGGVVVCASLGSGRDPGRVGVFLGTGRAEFHDERINTCFEAWRAEWLNEHREVVFAVTRKPAE